MSLCGGNHQASIPGFLVFGLFGFLGLGFLVLGLFGFLGLGFRVSGFRIFWAFGGLWLSSFRVSGTMGGEL